MPCCCAKNVKAAFVLGIVLAVLSFLSCLPFFFDPSQEVKIVGIIAGILGVMTHCILIFGAHKRHSTTILVWMVLAILECIGFAILAIAVAVVYLEGLTFWNFLEHLQYIPIGIVVYIFINVYISLLIWTVIVAKNVRKEIKADGSDLELGSI